jgi:hypothetical protein
LTSGGRLECIFSTQRIAKQYSFSLPSSKFSKYFFSSAALVIHPYNLFQKWCLVGPSMHSPLHLNPSTLHATSFLLLLFACYLSWLVSNLVRTRAWEGLCAPKEALLVTTCCSLSKTNKRWPQKMALGVVRADGHFCVYAHVIITDLIG